MKLQPAGGDFLLVADNEQQTVLVATENGFGKRTQLGDFAIPAGHPGSSPLPPAPATATSSPPKLVSDDDEIMLITTGGVNIRTRSRKSANWAGHQGSR